MNTRIHSLSVVALFLTLSNQGGVPGGASASAAPPKAAKQSTGSSEIATPKSEILVFKARAQTCSITPDGTRIAMSGTDDAEDFIKTSLRVYDVAAKKVVQEFELPIGPGPATLSSDGRRIIFGGGETVLADVASGKTIAKLTRANGDGISPYQARSSPDGKSFWINGGDAVVELDANTGKELRALAIEGRRVSGFGMLATGKQMAVGYTNSGVQIFDLATKQARELDPGKAANPGVGDTADTEPRSFASTADGKSLVVLRINAKPELWDLTTGKKVREWTGATMSPYSPVCLLGGGKAFVVQASWKTAKGDYDYSKEGNPLAIFDLAADKRLAYLAWPRIASGQFVMNTTLSKDGKILYVGLSTGAIQLFDVSAWGSSK